LGPLWMGADLMDTCRVKVTLDASQHASLKRFSELSGQSMSFVMADVLDSVLPLLDGISDYLEQSHRFSEEKRYYDLFSEALEYVKSKDSIPLTVNILDTQKVKECRSKLSAYRRFIKKPLEAYDGKL